jgi:hypothetical protein
MRVSNRSGPASNMSTSAVAMLLSPLNAHLANVGPTRSLQREFTGFFEVYLEG